MEAIEASLTMSTTMLVLVATGLGVAGVGALRSAGRHARMPLGFCVFFACFIAQAACAMCAMLCNNSAWVIFGAVLAAMAVGATLDSGRHSSMPAC